MMDGGTRIAKRRVVQVTWSLVAGGAEIYALTLTSHLDRDRFVGSLCALDEGGALEAEIKESNIAYRIMHRRPGIDWRLMWRLFRVFRGLRVDVIHTHDFNQLFYSALGATLLRARIIHTQHSIECYKKPRLRLALRVLSLLCHRVVAIGTDGAVYLREQVGISRHKLCIIRAGIDTQAFRGARDAVRAELGLGQEAPTAVIVARLFPEKNHLLLLEAFADVVKRINAARLLIVGAGTEESAIRNAIVELGLSDQVSLLGVRRDVASILAAADVFVLSSNNEGLPIAVLEAMAASKPVIATAVGDLPSVIEDGVTGRLVPPRSRASLANALVELLDDPERAEAMGRRAQLAAMKYSVHSMVESYETLYNSQPGAKRVCRS